MKSNDPVPSVAETDATGRTGEIFAEIRETLNVDVVNLVWRHLATMPGSLEWVWESLKPLYLGPAAGPAEYIRTTLPLPKLPPLSHDTLSAAGLDAVGLDAIRGVLDCYQHTNGLALVCFSALIARFGPKSHCDPLSPGVTHHRLAPTPAILPRLISVTEMTPALAGLVHELNRFGEDSDPDLLASMYRHLAHWPSYLALVRALLHPLHESGELLAVVADTRLLGARLGEGLAPAIASSPAGLELSPILAAVRRFAHHPIARMTAVCSLIRSATPS